MNDAAISIYGAGGHAKVVAEIAELNLYRNIFFVQDEPRRSQLLGYPILSVFEAMNCIVAIGANSVRKQITLRLQAKTFDYILLVHPRAAVSTRALIGRGTVVMAGATINSASTIGNHCIINTNSSVDHDCVLEDFVHLSPNAALAGNVVVGEGTHVGIGASVIQNIKIGRWCTIGAGAVVIRDVPDGATVVGNPARIIKQV